MPTVTAHNDQPDQADSLPAIFGQFSTDGQVFDTSQRLSEDHAGEIADGFGRLAASARTWAGEFLSWVERDLPASMKAYKEDVAKRLGVTVRSVERYLQQYQQKHSIAPRSKQSLAQRGVPRAQGALVGDRLSQSATESHATVKRHGATSSHSVVASIVGPTVEPLIGEDEEALDAVADSQSGADAMPPAKVLRRRVSRVLAPRKPANKAGARRLVAATPKSAKDRRDYFTPVSREQVAADRAAVEAKRVLANGAQDRDALAPIPDGPDWWMPIEVIEHIAAEATRTGKRPGAVLETMCYVQDT
jgi:hypothetical protein